MSWRCGCGAENLARATACEFCGKEQRVTTPNAKACAVCGSMVAMWAELHQGEDDTRRCGSCHMGYLKSRTSKPDDPCTEPGCTVRDHIAEFREYGRRISLRSVRL